MQYAPIALFVYDRLGHLRQTLDALQKNNLAGESELFIFSDGPKDKEAALAVPKVREYLTSVEGFRRVTVIERESNFGLSKSIITGVTELVAQYGKVIVLEDDCVVAPYFLSFMNDGLLAYENEEKVISLCGYMYPIGIKDRETLFLRVADCWGWATWKRGWDLFVADGKELYNRLKEERLFRKFNLDNSFNYTKLLKMQIRNRNVTWDVCWYASALLSGKLSLYPWKSLTMNIGIDGTGTNCGVFDYYRTELLNEPVIIHKIPVIENEDAMRGIGLFLKRKQMNIGDKILCFLAKKDIIIK